MYVLVLWSCSCAREAAQEGSGASRMGEVTGEEGMEPTGSSQVVAVVCV